MSKKTLISGLFVLAISLCLSGVIMAQDTTGSIVGTVHDANGAAVPNANVTITNSDTKLVTRTVMSNSDGEFSAPLLPVASYDITVEAPNFKKSVTTKVKLNVNEHHSVDVNLLAGNIAETVTVTQDPLQVDTQSATGSTVINGDQVRELTLNNRNWAQLITLSPGVSPNIADQLYVGTTNPNGGQSNALQIAVNGIRPNSNTYTVDGADTTDRGANLTVQTYPSVDAIREFSILRSLYPAESGRSSGGQVNVITKGGSSKFHGGLYEFVRNERLNANTFLSNRTAPLGLDANGKAIRAPVRNNNFGGTFSGPLVFPNFGEGGPELVRGRTFFFFSEEVRRVINYATLSSQVPSAALRQGIFPQDVCIGPVATPCSVILPAGTSLPQNLRSPLAAAYVQDIYNKLPLPSDAVGNLFFPARGVYNFRQELIRVDHKFSNAVSAYYRFENDTIPTIEAGGLFNGSSVPPFVDTTQTSSPGKTHVGRVTWVQSPTAVWEFGASYSFGDVPSQIIGLLNVANSPNIVAATPAFPFAKTRGRVPDIAGNGFTGLNTFGPYSDFSFNKAAFITFSKVFGAHTTKFGFNFTSIAKHENSISGANEGSYGAVSATPAKPGATTTNQQQLWANFLLGNFQTFTQSQLDITADLHAHSIEGFAQDEWRFRPNVTLYFGVRISRYGQPTDGNGRLTSFNPAFFDPNQAFQILGNGTRIAGTGNPLNGIIVNSQTTVAGATVSPWGKAVAPTRMNFAPRIGIAWDPFKKGTTSIRAGYGLYYDQLSFSFIESFLVAFNPLFQATVTANPTTLDNPIASAPPASLAAANVAGIDPNFKTPYAQHWSLDFQHQFGANTLVTVGYFGSRGAHLTGLIDANLLPPGYAISLGPTGCRTNSVTPATFGPCQTAGQVFTAAAQENILNQIRPYRGYGAVRLLQTRFDSNYHSLQVTAKHRFSTSSQINVAYTFSKNLTNSQNESATAPQNTYGLNNEYARANLDRRHVLSINYIYEIPYLKDQKGFVGKAFGGWQISGITYFYTGLGFSPATSNNDPAGLGLLGSSPSAARPDMICDPNAGAPHLFLQWFNTACFANPGAGLNQVGNSSRNVILGPSTTRFDATLSKRFRFGESKSLQLRWEVFNVLNHTNFTTFSSTNITSSTYGQINATRDPRTMQLGLKFNF